MCSLAILERIRRLPVVDRWGFDISFASEGGSRVTLPTVKSHHLGGMEREYLNGGTIFALFDAALASAAMENLGGRRCGTVEMSSKILYPVSPEGVVCRGRVLRRAGSLLFVEAELTGADGTVLAMTTGVVVALG